MVTVRVVGRALVIFAMYLAPSGKSEYRVSIPVMLIIVTSVADPDNFAEVFKNPDPNPA